ncbi:MAG TPA: hypothetical protein VJW20_19320 [Candidatus Angelobacter sp.]|nr:hypothetical protein [Candidatus Angelobacter sp.]
MMKDDAQQKIEAFLSRLRSHLRKLKSQDVEKMISEVRSEIMAKLAEKGEVSADAVDQVLASIGPPEEVASQYLAGILSRQAVSRSPAWLFPVLLCWAPLSINGLLALIGLISMYFLGLVLVLCALLKPLHRSAGVWVLSNGDISFRLGFGSPPAGGRDLLGWWVVPIGLALGCGLVLLTSRFVHWCARKYRKSGIAVRQG